jgi:hypothetical protein
MGLFRSAKEQELEQALLSLTNEFLLDARGSLEPGMLSGIIDASRERLAQLCVAVRCEKGPKGIDSAKKAAMSYMWSALTTNPTTSFRPGSPAKTFYDSFEKQLKELLAI